MRPPLSFGILILICQWRPSSMDVDSKSKWVDKKNDDKCPQQSENEKICISEREQLRQRVALCDTLPYTVEVLREQLNASTTREEKLTNELQHIPTKLDLNSKQSQGGDGKQTSPLTPHQSWNPWYFLADASRLEVFTINKANRYAKRENEKDRGFLPLFVKPGLTVGKVNEISFRIWYLCSEWLCKKDVMTVGVNAGIDVSQQQVWSSGASLMIHSDDGKVYTFLQSSGKDEFNEQNGEQAFVTYVGRPLLDIDVVTVQVDLTREVPLVKFAVNGEFGRQLTLQLPKEKITQLRFVVEAFSKGVAIEII